MTPIVGRDQELGLLLERWRDARTGEGQVVLLTGEAGIGKSRITEALIEAVSNEPHFLLRYQCSPYHVDSALYPAIQHLSHGAGFVSDDSNEQRLDKLEDLLRRSSDDIGSVAPLVASLLGLNGEARYAVADLTPQQRRNRTLAALGDQLSGLVGRKPVLWVIEDVHWIDPTTLEFIEMALDRVQNARVLILITARPTFVASFASHPVVTRLALNRLAKAATQSMVQRITGGKRLPEVLLDEIAARTDGVPLFVEEMTKAVIESGLLRETPDAYHLDGPLSTLAIPTTLHDSLMARLDRLHPVKEVAQTAAVIGRSFDHNMIAALSALPEAQLTTAMQRLVEAELVFRRGTPPDATYLFKHALVRDAAYESLLKTKRTAMHARLLEILENAGGTAPEVKAQHAEAAGLAERALGYWERAGSETLKRPAYKEAIASFENAIRLCSTLGGAEQWKRREQNLQLQLGQALMAYRGYQAPETLRAFNSAMLLADEIGDVSLQIPAAFGQWASGFILGIGSVELAERFAELAESQSDTGPRLVAYRALGLERFNGGRFKESRALMQTALAGYDPVAHHDIRYRFGHDPRIQASNYLAWNLWHLGFPDQAASLNEESLRCTMEIDHLNTKCISLCYGIIMTSIWLRRPDEVLKFATEALHISEAMSLPLYHAWAQIQLGWAMSQTYDSQGLDLVEMGIREARQIGAGRLEPLHLGLAAEAYAHAGRTLEAKAKISEALDALEKYRDFAFAADLYRIRAGLELRANKSGRVAAEADLRRALAIAGQQESPSLQLRAARDLAASLAEQGKRRQALDLLAPIYGWFTEGFETLDLKEAKTLLEQL